MTVVGRKMPPALLPEFFAVLGSDTFLAMSLLTSMLDQDFPRAVPYVNQIVALAGFGHLLVSRGFMTAFGEFMRFWYCFIYLLVALANVIALNLYLGISKQRWNLAKVFLGAVTAPVTLIAASFVSNYSGEATYQVVSLPQVPLELTYVAIITFDLAVIAIGLSAFFSLNWNRAALICSAIIAGTAICTLVKPPGWYFVVIWTAIILGIACAFILGASLYVFVRMKRETPGKTVRR